MIKLGVVDYCPIKTALHCGNGVMALKPWSLESLLSLDLHTLNFNTCYIRGDIFDCTSLILSIFILSLMDIIGYFLLCLPFRDGYNDGGTGACMHDELICILSFVPATIAALLLSKTMLLNLFFLQWCCSGQIAPETDLSLGPVCHTDITQCLSS